MPVIKLRGLPWSCSVDDIVKFLVGIKILKKMEDTKVLDEQSAPLVHLMSNQEGRPSGEAFVELEDEEDLEAALRKNNSLMGHRYIEVFRSNYDQLNQHLEESTKNTTNWSDPVVRLRGLPYGCVKGDIAKFFDGLNIGTDGIMMVVDFTGRFNGEAFVAFENLVEADHALQRHKQKIFNRYIEVFRSTFAEMKHYSNSGNSINLNKNAEQGGRFRKTNTKSFISSSFNSRSSSVNSFTNNARPKPYSRQETKPRGRPVPLMSTANTVNTAGYDDYDNYDNETEFNEASYVCENNHRHVICMNKNKQHIKRTGYGVKMRGLPFSASEDEIKQFFQGLNVVNIYMVQRSDQRPSGECEVDFQSHEEACEAMKNDKKFMGNRYIELFLFSGSMASSKTNNNNNNTKNNNSNMMSLGSLMTTDFSKNSPRQHQHQHNNNNNNNKNGLFTGFESYNTQSRMSHGPAQGEMLAEMAQKMFASVMGQFQPAPNNKPHFIQRRF